jgi:hypothetical protein
MRIGEHAINASVRRVCFNSLVSVDVSSEVYPNKAENSRPSLFFSCEKMNLVILGISSTRMGLIPKDWYINNTMTH